MKGFIIFAFLFAACFILEAQGDCTYEGKTHKPGVFYANCAQMTCHENGDISALTCPAFQCHEQIGYQEQDLEKPYPDCCARPICKE